MKTFVKLYGKYGLYKLLYNVYCQIIKLYVRYVYMLYCRKKFRKIIKNDKYTFDLSEHTTFTLNMDFKQFSVWSFSLIKYNISTR